MVQSKKIRVKTKTKAAIRSRATRPAARNKSAPARASLKRRAPLAPERALTLALASPFDDDAAGARVLGPYTFPTVTRRMKATFTVYADASGTINAMVYPHPTVTVSTMGATTALLGPVPGTIQWQSNSTGGTTSANLPNAYFGGFATSTVIGQTVSTWRVVGGGLRVIPTGSFTTTSGIMTVAPVPLHGELCVPTANNSVIIFDSGSTTFTLSDLASAFQWPGLPVANQAGCNLTGLDALPDSKQYSFAKLLENGGIEAVFRQVSPACQAFNAANSYGVTNGGGIISGQAGMTYAPGTNNSENFVGHPQTATSGRVDGWCGIAVYGTGLTASQGVDFEVILHMEGEPVIASAAAGAANLYESGQRADPVPSAKVESLIMSVMRSPPVRLIGEALKNKAVMGITSLMAAL